MTRRTSHVSAATLLLVATLPLLGCPGEPQADRARRQAEEALARGERETALDAIATLERSGADDPEALRERAVLLIRAGEAPRVVWQLEEALARFPDDARLRLLLAEAALLVNDPVRAQRALAPVPPGDHATAALVLRARAAMALGNLPEALALFEQAEATRPGSVAVREPRIAALLAERRFDDAGRALADAREAAGGEGEARLDALELALLQYRASDAERRLREALQQGDESATADARQALHDATRDSGALAERRPELLGAWQLHVGGLVAAGRSDDAARALVRERERRPPALALLPLLASVRLAQARPDDAEALLRELAAASEGAQVLPLVRFLAARDRRDEARAALREAAAATPDDPLTGYALASLALDDERIGEAERAIATLPASPERELLDARVALARGDAPGAVRQLEALAPRLDTAPTHFWLARALEANGDRAGAERRYALAVLRSPAEPGAYAELLRLARERGAWQEVAAVGRQLVLRAPGAIDGWEALVGALLRLGEPAAAEELARQAQDLLPGDRGASLLVARALRAQGRGPEALAALEGTSGETLDASLADALEAERVLALATTGRHDEALAAADRALARPSPSAELHHARALVAFGSGRAEEGDRSIDAALALEPDDPRPLHTRCRYRAATASWPEAERACRRYLEARPDDAEIRFVLGHVLDARGDRDAAIDAYRRAAELDPRAAAPRNNLAALLADRGDLDAALDAAQQAHALAEDDPQVLDTLAGIYRAKGLADRSLALLERAHALDPNLAEAELHLARAYAEADRSEDARRHLHALLARPDAAAFHPEAKTVLAALPDADQD